MRSYSSLKAELYLFESILDIRDNLGKLGQNPEIMDCGTWEVIQNLQAIFHIKRGFTILGYLWYYGNFEKFDSTVLNF